MPQRSGKRHVTKLRNYSSSDDLSDSLPPPVIVEKQPGQFAPAIAHEIRNPLSNINLAVEMLQSIILDEEHKLYLDIIMRASSRVNELVNGLLLYHQAGETRVEKTSVQQIVDEVLSDTRDRIMLKNIAIKRYFAQLDCKVLVDKQKVKMALTNIIINAIDAMPSEKGLLKLIIKSVNGKCIIEIEDNGIGISKENLKHIFEPYFTRKASGMGLGLSTTLETLVSNHARIAVQSEEGRGTRFIISFSSMLQAGKYMYAEPALLVV